MGRQSGLATTGLRCNPEWGGFVAFMPGDKFLALQNPGTGMFGATPRLQ